MFCKNQTLKQRENYKNMLKTVRLLSKLFSESDTPYVYYRYNQNIMRALNSNN